MVDMRRSYLETSLDILKVLRLYGPLRITPIMYKTNVNCSSLKERLNTLIQQNLVEEKTIGNKRTVYAITEKGIAALKHFKQLELTMQIASIDKAIKPMTQETSL